MAVLVVLDILLVATVPSEDGIQAPADVSAALGAGHIQLTWSAPGTGSVDDYVIWRNITGTPPSEGLNGTYYDSMDFTGAPLGRIDSDIDFEWGAGSPMPGIDKDTFSVRWTGYIRADIQGRYTFFAVSDDGVRLGMDGTVVCSDWTDHAVRECSGSIELAPGLHPLLVEFYENGGDAVCVLYWQPPSMPREKVPSQVLYERQTEAFEVIGIATNTSFKDGAVGLGVQYSYYVVARLDGVSSGPSEVVTATYAEKPTPPTNLECSRGADHVNLTWAPSGSSGGLPILGYKVYGGAKRGEEALLRTIESNTTLRFTDTGIDNSTTYYYYVTSYTSSLESDPSSVVVSAAPGEEDGGEDEGMAGLLSPINLACYSMLFAVLVSLSAVFVGRRRKWRTLVKLYDDGLPASNKAQFLRAMNKAILVTTLAMVLLLCMLGSTFLFSMAFVYSLVGDYVLLVFVLLAAYTLISTFLFVKRLNGLPNLDLDTHAELRTFIEGVSQRFGFKPPQVKLDAGEEPGASTISFLGGKTVIVLTQGLMDMHSSGLLDENQMRSVLGHEMGHIVNRDVTVTIILRPFIEFVRAVKTGLEWVVRFIVQLILSTLYFGLSSVLNLLIALIVTGLFIYIMLFVGIFYILFFLVFLALDLCISNYERQIEYGADLFGGLVSRSHEHISIALMELSRLDGINSLHVGAAKRIVAAEYRARRISWWKSKRNSYLREVLHRPDVQKLIDQAPDERALWTLVEMTDARWLLERANLEKITANLIPAFSQLRYGLKERLYALAMVHPLMAYRVKNVSATLTWQDFAPTHNGGAAV